MNIRKEQVLAGLTALLAVWIGLDYLDAPTFPARYSPESAPYDAAAVVPAPLVTDAAATAARRDFLTEPRETRPLPPRDLAFPPRAPLTVAGLPLDPGPDYRWSYLLRLDGALVEGVVLQQGAVAEGAPGASESEPPVGQEPGAAMDEAQLEKLYDRVWAPGLPGAFYGRLEAVGDVDLFELEDSGQFQGVRLRLRRFNPRENKFSPSPMQFGGDGQQQIERIALAGTLRNEVQRRVRKVPELPTAQGDRRALIDWLLEKGQTEAWIYDEALRQAEVYLQMSGRGLDGLAIMQKVLRARGDIDGELALLQGVSGDDRMRAFQLEGLGVLKMRLGLWIDAEADLREAARLAPTEGRAHGTLAEFYRQRGRSREAVQAARRARETLGSVQDKEMRGRVLRTIVGCLLGVGDVDGAREVVASVPAEAGQTYLRGAIAYAAGDMPAALAAFRQAGAGADAGAALLGQAACLCATGEWQAAHDLFVQVADQEPLLRHRACCGLALLHSRLGQFDTALGYVDRALEAAPNDPYALYVRGRTLRLMGQTAAAAEALTAALRVRDDFVHAIAEMSAVQDDLAAGAGDAERVAALVAARRYADRAVELAPSATLELIELQGLRAFGAADPRAATAAFEAARDLVGSEAGKAYARGALAVVAYSRGRVEDAMDSLSRLERDLPRDGALGQWAGRTLVAIEDHAQKESLGDGFERDQPGSVWSGDSDGPLGASIDSGRLVFRGTFSRGGPGEVSVARVGAVNKAKNFLACSATLALGPGHDVEESFVGVGIEVPRGSNGIDVSARVGLRDGKPFLRLIDGRDEGRAAEQQQWLAPELLVPGRAQELELRVVPVGEEQGRKLALHVLWNGALVHTHELRQLNTSSQTELKTILFAAGRKGGRVDAAFDDYRLERRKER